MLELKISTLTGRRNSVSGGVKIFYFPGEFTVKYAELFVPVNITVGELIRSFSQVGNDLSQLHVRVDELEVSMDTPIIKECVVSWKRRKVSR